MTPADHPSTQVRRKYQVFVSSTLRDLEVERQAVLRALLELDCLPVGMELFPAASEEQWTFIKRTIDECDYYVILVAGCYGSLDSTGVSYTEKEYRYASTIGKPVIAFLHSSPSTLPPEKREWDPLHTEKLDRFRRLCELQLCKLWESTGSLAAMVTSSLVRLFRERPSSGWVDGKYHDSVRTELGGAQQCLRKLCDIHQVEFFYRDRNVVHLIGPDGVGILTDEFTIVPVGGEKLLLTTKFGFHSAGPEPCRPRVHAWDVMDESPLSVCALEQTAIATTFAILLDQPSTPDSPRRIRLECYREHVWGELVGTSQTDNYFLSPQRCQGLSFRFESPERMRWKSLRASPRLGEVVISADGRSLEWKIEDLKPGRLGYRLCLHES